MYKERIYRPAFNSKNSTMFVMTKLQKQSTWLAVGYLVAAIFFMSVNPEKLSLIFILVPFLIIFGLSYTTINLVLGTFFNISQSQKRVVSLVLSIMPVLLLVIQSITQLTVRDVLLCVAITVILIWYSAKSRATSK